VLEKVKVGLLNEIETSSTNSSVPIVDLLRKCKVLAARLKHKELSDWANSELNGYSKEDIEKIPLYRRLHLSSPVGDFVGAFGRQLRSVPVPLFGIPKEMRDSVSKLNFFQPIAEIEELSSERENLQHNWNGDFIGYLQHNVTMYEGFVLMQAHSNVTSAMLKGIVDTVRTRILDYVLAIQIENPEADLASPSGPPPISAATLHQTFHTTIVGGKANVGGHGSQSILDFSGENVGNSHFIKEIGDEKIIRLLKELHAGATNLGKDEKDEALAALAKVESQLQKPKPDLERLKSYLDIAGNIVKLAPVAKHLSEHIAQLFK
jgi:hypothetical protein